MLIPLLEHVKKSINFLIKPYWSHVFPRLFIELKFVTFFAYINIKNSFHHEKKNLLLFLNYSSTPCTPKMSIAPSFDYTIPTADTINKGVMLMKKNDLQIVEIPLEKPPKGHVQVQVKCTGICGSDMHLCRHGEIGIFTAEKPLILGHESAGVVVALGEDVTSLQVGDRVAIEA